MTCFVCSAHAMDFSKKDSNGCHGGLTVAHAVIVKLHCDVADEFSSELERSVRLLSEQLSRYSHANHVVFLGDTGAGKSTLVNLLSGKEVVAEEVSGDILLTALGVHHGIGSGTEHIACHYRESDNTCYWDLPGLRDSAGWEKDVLNAILRKQLFDSLPQVKIVFVAKKADVSGRATNFGALVSHIISAFPGQNLDSCSYLALTQGSIKNMSAFLESVLQNSAADVNLSDPGVNAFLRFIQEYSAMRTSNFVEPQDLGTYDDKGAVEQMHENLAQVEGKRLHYKTILTPEAIIRVKEKAAAYNEQIADFIRGDISAEIKQAAHRKVSDAIAHDNKTAQQLKDLFGGYAKRLESLDTTNYIDGFDSFLADTNILYLKNDARFNLFSTLALFSDLLNEPLIAPGIWRDALGSIIEDLSKLRDVKIVDDPMRPLTMETIPAFHTKDDLIFDRKKNKRRWDRFDITRGVEFTRTSNFGALFGTDLILTEYVRDGRDYVVSISRGERDGWNFKGSVDRINITPTSLEQKIAEYTQHE